MIARARGGKTDRYSQKCERFSGVRMATYHLVVLLSLVSCPNPNTCGFYLSPFPPNADSFN